jgi:hypothetical protein
MRLYSSHRETFSASLLISKIFLERASSYACLGFNVLVLFSNSFCIVIPASGVREGCFGCLVHGTKKARQQDCFHDVTTFTVLWILRGGTAFC